LSLGVTNREVDVSESSLNSSRLGLDCGELALDFRNRAQGLSNEDSNICFSDLNFANFRVGVSEFGQDLGRLLLHFN
jgi:hypothetical protein